MLLHAPTLTPFPAASPTRAISTSQHGEEEQGTPEGFTATLTLINNPDVKVDTFVLSPSPDQSVPSSLREERIEPHLVRALERSAAGTTEQSSSTCQAPTEPDQFEAVCLAFGAETADPVGEPDCDDVDASISQLHKLNSMLRGGGRGAGRCPLVGSVTCAPGGVFVSRRDEDSGECAAISGGVVGAILSGGRDSSTSFQLVHAGKHAALRGSQFRITHMRGGNIAEVVPVQPYEASASSSSPSIISSTNDGYSWPRPRCIGAALSAAEWCKQAVSSATLFEKMAMQSALGIGLLERRTRAGDGEVCPDFQPAPLGVMPCLPAQSCFDVQEVEPDGSLRLSEEAELGQLRAGDLCDFRAVGALASLQAEQDAYAWLHASRISSAIRRRGDISEQCGAASEPSVIQGCLVASARARFPGGFEGEGCEEVVTAASGPGGLPTVGIVSDVQLVSVDNTMMTCSSNAGFAGVYVCGSSFAQEKCEE